jgi:hypothetical protein
MGSDRTEGMGGSDRVFIHNQTVAPPETGDATNSKVEKSYLRPLCCPIT